MTFRPRLWPTLFTVPAMLAMLGLGTWQVERLAWKNGLIADFEARAHAAPVAPPATLDDPGAWQFRHVRAEGRFLNDKEIQLTGRTYEGNAGYHVVTPLVTPSGQTILVNRGWVPEKKRRPESRPETLPPGPVTVDALLRLPQPKGYFVPPNDPRSEDWFTLDPDGIAAARGLGPVAPYYLDALRPGPKLTELPFAVSATIQVRNDHLQYAITWYSLAVTLAVIYVLWHRQKAREENEP